MARGFDRLVERLRSMDVVLPDRLSLHRTHAGHWQRSAGAWSWYALDAAFPRLEIIASHWRIRDLLRCSNLIVEHSDCGTLEIDPGDYEEMCAVIRERVS